MSRSHLAVLVALAFVACGGPETPDVPEDVLPAPRQAQVVPVVEAPAVDAGEALDAGEADAGQPPVAQAPVNTVPDSGLESAPPEAAGAGSPSPTPPDAGLPQSPPALVPTPDAGPVCPLGTEGCPADHGACKPGLHWDLASVDDTGHGAPGFCTAWGYEGGPCGLDGYSETDQQYACHDGRFCMTSNSGTAPEHVCRAAALVPMSGGTLCDGQGGNFGNFGSQAIYFDDGSRECCPGLHMAENGVCIQ